MLVRVMTEADADRVLDLRAIAFNVAPSEREASRADMSLPDLRVVEDESGLVVGVARLLRFAHFWGGRAVPAAGVAGVAVAPEARGRGVGTTLMTEILRELRADGVAISSLYPATALVYKRCGYGFGGIRTFWKASLSDLPSDSRTPLEPFGPEAIDEVNACYEKVARAGNGLVRRDRARWEKRVLKSWDGAPNHPYLVREDGEVTGYIVYRTEKSKDDWRFTMDCRDLFWTTPTAARALLSLGSLHRSTGVGITWAGPPTEPLVDLLAEDVVEIDNRFRWMVRLIDVPSAFESRGYPPRVEAGITIAVRDSLLPDNEGPWRVEVAQGSAKVAPGEAPDAVADAETWASLWSGLHSARDEIRTGRLQASDDAVATLESMFAGPLPWLADFY